MAPSRVFAAALTLALTAGCSSTAPGTAPRGPATVAAAPAAEPQALECLLQAPDHVGLGEPVVPVTFTLRNGGRTDLRVLARHTPLEGMLGDIFEVTRDGERLGYRGRMVKRGPPGENEFITLAPGDHLRATVDLLEGYDLTLAGQYGVRYAGVAGYTCNELRITRD